MYNSIVVINDGISHGGIIYEEAKEKQRVEYRCLGKREKISS